MKRLTTLLSLVGLLVGTTQLAAASSSNQDVRAASRPDSENSWAQSVVDTLSLPERVAQLLVVQEAPHLETDRSLERVVAEGVGGIRICQRHPLAQTHFLNELQYRAVIPLLVTQHSSCRHPSYRTSTTDILPMDALAAVREQALVQAYARMIGQRAQLTGVHQIYGPETSASAAVPVSDRDTITTLGRIERQQVIGAYVNGVESSGVVSTTRYVRSAGGSGASSFIRPVASRSSGPSAGEKESDRLDASAGNITVAWPHPGSSRAAALRRLREFPGPDNVVTVDLSVSGRTYSRSELHRAAVEAVQAGADQLVIRPDDMPVLRTIVQAVRKGHIRRSSIRLSATSVLHMKEQRRLHERRDADLNAVAEQTAPEHWTAMNREVGRRSLTLLSNAGEVVPLAPMDEQELLHVSLTENRNTEDGQYFRRQLRTHATGGRVIHQVIDRAASASVYEEAVMGTPHYDAVIVSLFLDRLLSSQQRRLIEEMSTYEIPVIVVNFGPAGLVGDITGPEAALLAWSSSQPVQDVAAQALFGKSAVSGQLPYTISSRYPSGTGLSLEQRTLREGAPQEVGMQSQPLQSIDRLLHQAVADSAFPGAAIAIGRTGVLTKLRGYGYETYESARPVTPQSKFDLASLTKVIATTTAAMKLYEADQLDLNAPVSKYWPAFGQHEKDEITIRHLLTHTSGLRPFHHPYTRIFATPFFDITRPFTPFFRMEMQSREDMFEFIASDTLEYDPGEQYTYSDLNMITLMHVVERITGQNMGDYLQESVFEPLGMTRTGYRGTGPAAISPETIPTEVDRTFRARLIRGEVHDEAAYIMGGTSGHAGLFSTAEDLAFFADMLIRGGTVNGHQILERETIELFTKPVDPDEHTRALGWDTKSTSGYSSAGDFMGPNSFGHTGFTGTSFWIDPDQDLFVILLTNRVHPTRANRGHIPIRPEVANRAYRSIHGPADILLSELLNLP